MSEIPSDYSKPPWIKMPISELTRFAPGRVCNAPSWWAVTDDDCVLFYKTLVSPQCNVNRAIVERIGPGLRVQFIEQAFVPQRP